MFYEVWVTIQLLSIIDITLTYYVMFLMKKKGCFDVNDEKGILAHYIMRLDDAGELSFLAALVVIQLLLYFMIYILNDIYAMCMMMGMFMMVNIYHYLGLSNIRSYWNQDRYWSLKKKINEI